MERMHRVIALVHTAREAISAGVSFSLMSIGLLPDDDTMEVLKVLAVALSIFASCLAIIWWALRFYEKYFKNK